MDRRQSTRTAALIRLGLPPILWARWASDFQPFRDLEPWKVVLSASFMVSTTLMFFGVKSRLSTAWAGLSAMALVYGVGHGLGVEAYTHHHTTMLAAGTCLLALTPCGGSYSVDRWWVVARAERTGAPPPPERGPTWALPLIGVLVSAVYIWGAWDKTTWAYFSGQRFQHYVMHLYVGSDFPDFPGFEALCFLAGAGSMALEYVLGPGLFFRRLQPVLIPVGVLFHAVIYWTMPVATFSVTMWLFYLAYLDPDVVHRFLDRISAPSGPAPSAE